MENFRPGRSPVAEYDQEVESKGAPNCRFEGLGEADRIQAKYEIRGVPVPAGHRPTAATTKPRAGETTSPFGGIGAKRSTS